MVMGLRVPIRVPPKVPRVEGSPNKKVCRNPWDTYGKKGFTGGGGG